MVMTVEPGIYISAAIPKWRRSGAVSAFGMEDDVVVTADGCEVLTAAVPKGVAEIEALMAG